MSDEHIHQEGFDLGFNNPDMSIKAAIAKSSYTKGNRTVFLRGFKVGQLRRKNLQYH